MVKWIFILLLLLFCSIIAQAQNSRWKQFPLSDTSSKIFIDTTRTQKIIGFDGRVNVVVLWAKLFIKPLKKGDPTESLEKFAVDVETSQIELKLLSAKINGKEEEHLFDDMNWKDIYPESPGEAILNYCKQYLKSLKRY